MYRCISHENLDTDLFVIIICTSSVLSKYRANQISRYPRMKFHLYHLKAITDDYKNTVAEASQLIAYFMHEISAQMLLHPSERGKFHARRFSRQINSLLPRNEFYDSPFFPPLHTKTLGKSRILLAKPKRFSWLFCLGR